MTAQAGGQAGIDWAAVHAEALDILVRYLRIPSVNPPGNEAPAARFLGALIEAEGIACEYIETAPGREVVAARLRGDGSKGPLMLCNHLDVVPVEADFWNVPPFEGVVRDGFVFGRGAVDMKGAGVMQLIAFLLLARRGVPLRRDVVFCGVPDEEAGGRMGMGWLCEHRPDIVEVAYELNEGGMGSAAFAGRPARLFRVATSEKKACGLRLRAVGAPGHGSRPHRDNSLIHLARAIIRLADWERPLTINQQTGEYLRRLAAAGLIGTAGTPHEPGAEPKDQLEHLLPGLVETDPALQAMFINTLNVTMIHAGTKINVVPALSEAMVDCRLLPEQDPEAWRQQVIERIADDRIEVTFARDFMNDTEDCPWDTELFHTIETVVKDAMEDAVITPVMTVGGTDNKYLRERGIPAYGFIPVLLTPEEAAGFHGNNEKLSLANLNLGCELTYEVVRRFCS